MKSPRWIFELACWSTV